MAYMHVEFHHGNPTEIWHNAILTPDEVALYYPGETLSIVGFMSDEEAAGLSYTERGLAHLDP